MADRRFPPPWTFEEANGACFVVKDANGFAMSYVYYESEPGRRHRRQPDDQRRSSPDRRQYREATRAAWRRAEAGRERTFSQKIARRDPHCAIRSGSKHESDVGGRSVSAL